MTPALVVTPVRLRLARGLAVLAWAVFALTGCATCGDPSRGVWSIRYFGPYGSPDEAWLRQQLASAVERHLVYPPEACRKGLSGLVVVNLQFDQEGAIRGVDLAQTSGHAELDQVLLQAWQRAQAQGERFVLTPQMREQGVSQMRYGVNFAKP
jgi:TonB family protein